MKSGATGEVALAPVRAKHVLSLRERFPDLDDLRLSLLADRLARVELATVWLDAQGGVVRDKQGRIYDVADRVEKWASTAERVLREIEREQKTSKRFDLAASMAEIDRRG